MSGVKNLKPYKKGQSGNPGGRPKDPPELKKIRQLSRQELVEIGNLVIRADVNELKKIRKDGTTGALKAMVVAIALRAIVKGEHHAFEALMTRLIGKVHDEIKHTGLPAAPAQTVIFNIPSNGREAKKP